MTTLEIENTIGNDVGMGLVTQLEKPPTNNAFYDTDTFTKHSDESFSATLQKAIDLSINPHQNGLEDTEINDKQFYYSSGSNNFLLEKHLKAETIKTSSERKIKQLKPVLFERPSGLEMLSFPYSNYNIKESVLYKEADVINLHWVSMFFGFSSFF